ncbi:MAG: C25 family cysteine peptidase [Candidatus Desulfofervidus auxilii]|nr:C25 family cysteine peptidase [Candidatus Desulfofervidus auxilii]
MKRISIILLAISLILTFGNIVFAETYEYIIEAGEYEIVDLDNGYQEIKMKDFGQLLKPGEPKLPSKIFFIAIPPGVKVNSVKTENIGVKELPGVYKITPAPMVSPLSATIEQLEKIKADYEKKIEKVYSSDILYPAQTGYFVSQGGYRKYNLVQVRYSPFSYRPKSGKLYFCPKLKVIINYSYSEVISFESKKFLYDYVPEAEERAAKFIINYEEAQKWYPAPLEDSIDTPSGFVIITTEALEDAIWPIKNWEICKGRAVYVETVEDIDTNYSGADLAEKIRNFLRDHLSSWNIIKVLLVGDISDVPMRYTYPKGPDGPDEDTTPWELEDRVPTDYYYAELSLPDNQSWNSNGDNMYGQEGVDNVQFPNEVDVGRIPWSDPDIVEDICMKMVEFEYSTDMDYKLNYLLTGAFFWEDTDNAVLKTYIINHELDPGNPPVRIYEQGPCWDSDYYSEYALSRTITREVWGDGHFGFVNLAGHGSHTGVYYKERHPTCTRELYFHANDRTYLNDNYPSIVFSCACSTAWPEDNNLGKMLLEQGAVSFVGSTRVAFGVHEWDDPSDGGCQTLDYLFAHYAVSYTFSRSSVGWSLQRALQDMYNDYNWDDSWWQMFEWNLYSNPDLWLRDRPSALPNLTYITPSGWDYPIVPRSTSGCTDTWCPVTDTLPGNTNDTYFNWAWINNGNHDAPNHRTVVYIDDRWIFYSEPSLSAGSIKRYENLQTSVNISGGRHTLYYNIDSNEEVWETNESDNCWGHQFVWSPYPLSDDSPITRSAPPIKDAWGCAPAPRWYNNDGFSFIVQQEHPNKWWSAVGILPASSTVDYDLRLWDRGDYTGSEHGFGGGYLEWSSYGGDASDFVIVNDNMAPAGTYYAGVINYNEGTADFRIEEDTSVKIYEGTNGPYSKASHNVLDIYECYLSEGEYGFKLVQISGNCDLGMSLYDDETVHCKKSEYMPGGYANNTGDGGDEFFKVDIPDAGFHALVVWKVDSSDYNKSCTYKIKMGKCADPTTPSNPDPVDGATDVSIYTNLDWADCANTDHYEVWLKKEGESWQKLGETEESEWDISDSLEYETTYTWAIKAVNICDNYTWGPYWTFTTSAEPKPELFVTSIHTNPVYPEPGQTVNIQVTIKNQGDLDAGAFYTSFYKHRTTPPSVGDSGDCNWYLSSLASGDSRTFSCNVIYDKIGCYQMYAQVDTFNNIDEGEEKNNVFGPKNIIVGRCYADFDHDGGVDRDDLAVFAAAFGSTSSNPNYNKICDFDYDYDVDGFDLAIFASEYGRMDCPLCP